METYEIYKEGYSATGDYAPACLIGEQEGVTFEDACERFMETYPEADKFYDPDRNSYWGCRLYPTLEEARRAFG